MNMFTLECTKPTAPRTNSPCTACSVLAFIASTIQHIIIVYYHKYTIVPRVRRSCSGGHLIFPRNDGCVCVPYGGMAIGQFFVRKQQQRIINIFINNSIYALTSCVRTPAIRSTGKQMHVQHIMSEMCVCVSTLVSTRN